MLNDHNGNDQLRFSSRSHITMLTSTRGKYDVGDGDTDNDKDEDVMCCLRHITA